METKRVTEDFAQRGGNISTLEEISSTMEKIELLFEECDVALGKAGLSSTGYQKQDNATVIDNMISLATYVSRAWEEAYVKLDVPLCKDFANGATHAISQIKLDEITTENTFSMEEHKEVYASGRTIYKTKVNKTLTMSDFMGVSEMEPGEGIPVLENVESVGWFKNEFRKPYEEQGFSGVEINALLKIYVDMGSFEHDKRQPGKELLSGLADAIPVVKPAIDAITGKNYITGEELTDLERAIQGTVAVLDIVTLGHGAVALKASGMGVKDITKTLGKRCLVDTISGMSSYTVGSVCDANGMPPGAGLLLSILTGSKVSEYSGKYFLTDMASGAVTEYTLDEVEDILRTGNVDGIVSEGVDAAGQAVKTGEKVVDGIDAARSLEAIENVAGMRGTGTDIIELSNSNIQHIKKHTFEGMAEQAKYLTDEQITNKLNNTSFFNKDWSQEEIIQYTQEAYNVLRSQGKTGLQSIEINGEIINVFIKEDGTFDTAYGVYKYTVDDFRKE